MMRAFGLGDAEPVEVTSSLLELIAGPSPVKAVAHVVVRIRLDDVRMTGSSNSVANSKSRSSWPGTAMIAPVP